MDKESIIRMARESANGMLTYDAEGEWRLSASETERFAALVAAAEREAISDEYSSRLQGDLENGVRWLNEAASKEFQEKYPELAGFLQWLDDRESG